MKWLKRLSILGLFLLPAVAFAKSEVTQCHGSHLLRLGGAEIRFTVFNLINADVVNPAVIERITIRDHGGNMIHDSGPEVGIPHPLANIFTPPLDVTTVPPGASYVIATSDIWGFNSVPGVPGTGVSLSVRVKVSKDGKRDLFVVKAGTITRERFANATTGVGRAAGGADCFTVKDD